MLGCRAAHHVADHVAARGERGEPGGVDRVDDPLQIGLVHEVQLHALAGGQPQRAVGALGKRSRASHCSGVSRPRHRGAHHARVVERQLLESLAADVAVVLLVDAVELEQRLAVPAERGVVACQLG